MAVASDPADKRKSKRSVKPKTDPDFLYDYPLPAWTPSSKELQATPKLAELFSEKKPEVKPKKQVAKAVKPEASKIGGDIVSEEWLHLKRETLALELEVVKEKQKLARLSVNQGPISMETKLNDNVKLEKCDEEATGHTFETLQQHVPSLASLRKQEKTQKIDWPQDFVAGTIAFDRLDMAEFVAGYLEMIVPYENSIKTSMYEFLKLLMDKAIFYSWPSVRSFYAFCAKQVEIGRVSWNDSAYFANKALVHFKHSDLRSRSTFKEKSFSATSFSQSKDNGNVSKNKDAYCKAWNYSAKCSCNQSDSSYKDTHCCKVCDRQDHPMLHCPKRRMPIPPSW